MKFWSEFYIPTLKESPADAEIASHQLLVRAGLVRKLSGGLYTYMPIGLRVMQKITQICREEIDRGGSVELWMPHVHPAENWEKGPRWNAAREIMFRADHAGSGKKAGAEPEFVLGPTHEEVITPLVKAEVSSYRDLPKSFYQIATKFRNEIRPRYGLMRAREFVMMDAYSFDADDEGAIKAYHKMKAAYEAFFKRVGVLAIAVEADTGVMGGSFSHEFMVPAEVGDDDVIYCEESGYAANREKATSGLVATDFVVAEPIGEIEKFATPGVTTIKGLAREPHNIPADEQFKTLVYIGDDKPFLVLLRGCDDLEEAKLGTLGFTLVRPATPDEITPLMGAKPGSLGAVKDTLKAADQLAGVFADEAIKLVGNGTTGANEDGFHLRNVNVTRDLAITGWGDFRTVKAGEPCPTCGAPLKSRRGIEVGHIFKLGTKYSECFAATYVDDQKQSHPMVMGCYGIGISRTMQAVIEQSHDKDGIIWPWAVAPFQVLIVLLDPAMEEAATLAKTLGVAAELAGADILIDDRDERPGVKFKDADLIGVPLRITIGGRGLKNGVVEVKWRHESEVVQIPVAEAASRIAALVEQPASA
ncbi:proline--tRNA ligase [Synoicihabitans lomoniglobus]|uniref:Proline--tRNA ligase n=1 Tax=Synoicihabitans lomoniglobus TaxID=2909285 RepID=A0AAF0CSK4_9BACT|nr:proline--tRNA ligase [Opitutaceae bacterium LMO-M01]WED67314.1 proline--tRNA ligase [Opitutaceae bacterium LMO-M01]